MIRIGEGWDDLVAGILRSDAPERVYVVGATDSGKTTLCRYLVDEAAARTRTAYVDCDTGQSRLGPPTTEGMALYPGTPEVYVQVRRLDVAGRPLHPDAHGSKAPRREGSRTFGPHHRHRLPRACRRRGGH